MYGRREFVRWGTGTLVGMSSVGWRVSGGLRVLSPRLTGSSPVYRSRSPVSRTGPFSTGTSFCTNGRTGTDYNPFEGLLFLTRPVQRGFTGKGSQRVLRGTVGRD